MHMKDEESTSSFVFYRLGYRHQAPQVCNKSLTFGTNCLVLCVVIFDIGIQNNAVHEC